MKDLFTIEFDFLGRNIKLQVMTYDNSKAVNDFFETEKPKNILCFFTTYNDVDYVVLHDSVYNQPYCYTHEFLHATHKILRGHFCIEDDEAECYMLGYLVQTYYDFLYTQIKTQEELNNDTTN